MRMERQAAGFALPLAGGGGRGAEDGLVAEVHAVELADGQDERRFVGGGEGHRDLNIQCPISNIQVRKARGGRRRGE